ncbi:MAG: hypothetical protein P4L82_17325 [Ancalomicrobiaceae bacterium]|nr:hypothetical protein [Ancalomicrobiaceae bacterium]
MAKHTDRILAKLSTLCQSIAAGRYDGLDELFALADAQHLSEDIKGLAEAFGLMAVQIEAREFRLGTMIEELEETGRQLSVAKEQLARENTTLKLEVNRLRIEIDHTRKDQEVAEITDTDYFQELQLRARALRERRNTGPKDP